MGLWPFKKKDQPKDDFDFEKTISEIDKELGLIPDFFEEPTEGKVAAEKSSPVKPKLPELCFPDFSPRIESEGDRQFVVRLGEVLLPLLAGRHYKKLCDLFGEFDSPDTFTKDGYPMGDNGSHVNWVIWNVDTPCDLIQRLPGIEHLSVEFNAAGIPASASFLTKSTNLICALKFKGSSGRIDGFTRVRQCDDLDCKTG